MAAARAASTYRARSRRIVDVLDLPSASSGLSFVSDKWWPLVAGIRRIATLGLGIPYPKKGRR